MSTENDQQTTVNVEREHLEAGVSRPRWRSQKETTRSTIAVAVVVIFGVALVGLGYINVQMPANAAEKASLLTTAIIPLLDALGRLFGPLLAFILGYYFSGN